MKLAKTWENIVVDTVMDGTMTGDTNHMFGVRIPAKQHRRGAVNSIREIGGARVEDGHGEVISTIGIALVVSDLKER